MKKWVSSEGDTAFASIRRLQRLAYQECRNYVSPPQVQFLSRYGSKFTFDGIPLDAIDFATMFHTLYDEMKQILEELTFGITRTEGYSLCRLSCRDAHLFFQGASAFQHSTPRLK
jgi:hypothetical protein